MTPEEEDEEAAYDRGEDLVRPGHGLEAIKSVHDGGKAKTVDGLDHLIC